jgi:polyisoprenyl-phosphate glycosyltransferase
MIELSVVVPVYDCRDCLRALHQRLRHTIEPLTESYELVFVDDRSRDGSWEVLLELAGVDPRVRLLRLTRNFGQHMAITAGLAETSGRWVVVTDCDLEDPPEQIQMLYAKAQRGYDFVLSRRKRRRQSLFRRAGARVYRWLANTLAGTDVDPHLTNLSIASRPVIDAVLRLRDQDRQYILILLWLGYDHAIIEVEQHKRYAGQSAYSFAELVRVAADGIFFQTTRLLRWIVYAGFAIALLGALFALLIVYRYTQSSPPAGWASLAVLVLILSGFIMTSTGVMGLYIGKIFGQVKGRPLYVVDKRIAGGAELPAYEGEAAREEVTAFLTER